MVVTYRFLRITGDSTHCTRVRFERGGRLGVLLVPYLPVYLSLSVPLLFSHYPLSLCISASLLLIHIHHTTLSFSGSLRLTH